jgi:hypothetical protein
MMEHGTHELFISNGALLADEQEKKSCPNTGKISQEIPFPVLVQFLAHRTETTYTLIGHLA